MTFALYFAAFVSCLNLALAPLLNGGTFAWGIDLIALLGYISLTMSLLVWIFDRPRAGLNRVFVGAWTLWVLWIWWSVTYSPNTLEAVRWALLWSGVAANAVALHLLAHARGVRTLALSALLLGGALSVGVGYLQQRGFQVPLYQRIEGPYLTGPFYNPSHFAGYLIAVVGVGSTLFFTLRRSLLTVVLLALVGVTLYIVLFTDSSSTPAVFLTVPFAFLLWLVLRFPRWGAWMIVLSLLVTSAVGYTFFTPKGQQLFAQYKGVLGLSNSWSGFLDGRTNVWDYGVRIARDHALKGVGIGQFGSVSPAYRREFSSTGSLVDKQFVNYAHNDALQIVSETGLIGLALWVLIVLSVLLRRGVNHSTYAFWVALLGLMFAGVYDAHLTAIPSTLAVVWALSGVAARGTRPLPEALPSTVALEPEPTRERLEVQGS